MKTLIVYDFNGHVISTLQGGNLDGVASIVADVPKEKLISHVNIETGEVVLIDPPTEPTYEELKEAYNILTGGEVNE